MTRHTRRVGAVACGQLEDGRTLFVSGGNEGSLILWPRQTLGDALNRGVLAADLERLLIPLTTEQGASTPVVHIDGKRNAGKLLVERFVERLPSAHQQLNDPVVVWYDAGQESKYDAGQESKVAPERSLARSIDMEVRRQRALATRVTKTVTGAVARTARSRTARSRLVLVAGAVLITMLVAWASGLWKGDVGKVCMLLTTFAALATLGLELCKVLLPTSSDGRRHQRDGDNPGSEFAATVASIRRWSPRGSRGHRVADTLFAWTIIATITEYLRAVLQDPTIRSAALAELRWIRAHGIELVAAAITALLVIGCWQGTPESRSPPGHAPQPRPTSPRSRIATWCLRMVVLAVATTGAYMAFSPGFATRWLPPLPMIQRHPGGSAVSVVLGCAALYALWTALRWRQPRRPILLIIDNLDDCSKKQVVKLLKTVHCLRGRPAEIRLLRGWRRPAPLIVLVVADGRKLRTAFEKLSGAQDSPVHGHGADFLQKVFDATVRVAALTPD